MTSPSHTHHQPVHHLHHYHHQYHCHWRFHQCSLLLASGIIASLVAVILLHGDSAYRHSRQPFQGFYDDRVGRSPWPLQFRERKKAASSKTTTSTTTTKQIVATFKILQIADIHTGEATETDWGPLQDVKTWRVLNTIIPLEKPDLIVLSGDQLTANNVVENATAYYRLLGQRLSYHGIPWALIFGNHDDAPYEIDYKNGTIIKVPAKTSREQLLAVDQKFPLSMTQSSTFDKKNAKLFGATNYVLNVQYPPTWQQHDRNNKYNNVAVQLFFLDSGGGSLPEQLEVNQIEWFQQQHRPDIAGAAVFQHIPTTEFNFHRDYGTCRGLHDEGVGVEAINPDPGLVSVLQRAGNVQWLGVGHVHGNDYCCPTTTTTTNTNMNSSLHVCFGRHSGYGGYGTWDRGTRVYELELLSFTNTEDSSFSEEEDANAVSVQWRSYVRMENGSVIDVYEPFQER